MNRSTQISLSPEYSLCSCKTCHPNVFDKLLWRECVLTSSRERGPPMWISLQEILLRRSRRAVSPQLPSRFCMSTRKGNLNSDITRTNAAQVSYTDGQWGIPVTAWFFQFQISRCSQERKQIGKKNVASSRAPGSCFAEKPQLQQLRLNRLDNALDKCFLMELMSPYCALNVNSATF